MAENRTIQFVGQGYGADPVSITASINSTQIYSGTIPTIAGPTDGWPVVPPAEQVILFSIDNSAALNTDFAGSLPMTIVVSGGNGVLFGEINLNYYLGNVLVDPNAGTVNNFSQNYDGNPPNSDGSGDPRSSVAVNGTPCSTVRPPDGCWNYYVPTDSTFTYNWNISIGQIGNNVGSTTSYTGPYTTTAPS
jgi:hypothetical protein